jgi:hypothetical protein
MWDNNKEPDFLDVEDDEFDEEEGDDEDEDEEDDEDEDEEPYERISFTIPKDMRNKVKKFARDLNLSVSELVRGSLDGIMALSEVGVDLGKQIEEGLKEGLKGLKGLKDLDLEKFENIQIDFDDAEYEEKMKEYEKKMEEYGKKMEEYGKKMGEKAQRIIEKNLAHLDREYPYVQKIRHVHPPMPPRAPHAPLSPEFYPREEYKEQEREQEIEERVKAQAQLRAPIEKIKLLNELKKDNLISEEEFEEKKKKILDEF